MDSFKQFIERALEFGRELLDEFLRRSHANVNRRTGIILSVLAVLFFFSYLFFLSPPRAFPEDGLIEIPEGATLSEIADILKREHVIRSTILLRSSVYLLGYERGVHFGDYIFHDSRNVFSIARSIGIGAYGLEPIRVRISEGATIKEMAAILEAKLKRFDEEEFIEDSKLYEGYLFPDTYFFLPNADNDLVLRTLRENFYSNIENIREEIQAFGKPLKDVITMASILEREAQDSEDRRKIAGVLWSRIEIGMALQVDAVFLYTSGKSTFELTSADLKKDDPYNTYTNKGLPPTPIGSPSLDSILAAVTPIESDFVYYLADKNNVTHYSETYEEHLRKKRKYLGS